MSIAIIVLVLIIDQIIKIEVKTNMTLGQHIPITSWFQIAFVENNGMAFGMSIGSKLLLTTFRIITVGFLLWYIMRLTRRQFKTGFIVCLSMIVAGAIGNIVDCIFYGEVFTQSTHIDIAKLVPWGEGYGSVLEGRVVDMFYFPLIEWDMPGWMWLNDIPLIPNAYEHCIFFSPVFNFADANISVGVVVLAIFYRKTLSKCLNAKKEESEAVEEVKEARELEDDSKELNP
ncbi:MAG: lipoprotein signal peptidase [Bacteroidaceae bacterium]|nr:lipoprotein signal peptidase [Bacteroidaceae bacterium]